MSKAPDVLDQLISSVVDGLPEDDKTLFLQGVEAAIQERVEYHLDKHPKEAVSTSTRIKLVLIGFVTAFIGIMICDLWLKPKPIINVPVTTTTQEIK